MLIASVATNIALTVALAAALAALAATFGQAKNKIREEKLATYAGCLAAITAGLGTDNKSEQLERTSISLSSILISFPPCHT